MQLFKSIEMAVMVSLSPSIVTVIATSSNKSIIFDKSVAVVVLDVEHFHGSVAAGAIEGALVGDRAGLQQVAGGAAAVVVTIAEDGLGVGALAHEDQQHVDHLKGV